MDHLLHAAELHSRECMSRYDASHDYKHIQRVLRNALDLAINDPNKTLDLNVITLAALLHDIGDRKYLKPGQNGGFIVHDFLMSAGATKQLAVTVQDIVNHVSHSHEIKNPEAVTACIARHPELAIVQDADRLDALGAVGMARCFVFNATKFPQNAMEDAIQHFDDKLFGLKDMMKTTRGRQLAKERTDLIRAVRASWESENVGVERG